MDNKDKPLVVSNMRENQLRWMHQRLDAWFEVLNSEKPSMDDGEIAELAFYGGYVGMSAADEPMFDIRVKETMDRSL